MAQNFLEVNSNIFHALKISSSGLHVWLSPPGRGHVVNQKGEVDFNFAVWLSHVGHSSNLKRYLGYKWIFSSELLSEVRQGCVNNKLHLCLSTKKE